MEGVDREGTQGNEAEGAQVPGGQRPDAEKDYDRGRGWCGPVTISSRQEKEKEARVDKDHQEKEAIGDKDDTQNEAA